MTKKKKKPWLLYVNNEPSVTHPRRLANQINEFLKSGEKMCLWQSVHKYSISHRQCGHRLWEHYWLRQDKQCYILQGYSLFLMRTHFRNKNQHNTLLYYSLGFVCLCFFWVGIRKSLGLYSPFRVLLGFLWLLAQDLHTCFPKISWCGSARNNGVIITFTTHLMHLICPPRTNVPSKAND